MEQEKGNGDVKSPTKCDTPSDEPDKPSAAGQPDNNNVQQIPDINNGKPVRSENSIDSIDSGVVPECAMGSIEDISIAASEGAASPAGSSPVAMAEAPPRESVNVKVLYNKKKYDVTADLEDTVEIFKQKLVEPTGLPAAMQKIMFKGLAKDELTLRQLGVTNGAKIMVVGSTLNDILAVTATPGASGKDDPSSSAPPQEPLCKQKLHRKILDKGIPDDVMPGIRNVKDALPSVPLSGMMNKLGGKVRLTFKLENDQLWIGTKERTDKISMSQIKSVVSEPIEGFEHYHIMGLQLGTTEASRYWIYWVPAQYVDAIKDSILGKWQYF